MRFAAVELLAPPEGGVLRVGFAPGELPPLVRGALARVTPPAAGGEGDLIAILALHGASAPQAGAWPWESALESLSIAEARDREEELLASCFREAERRALAGSRTETLAGRVAAKRAIGRALAAAGAHADEAALVIARAPREAPRLAEGAPAGMTVLFSIAHTRTTAYAVAAVGV